MSAMPQQENEIPASAAADLAERGFAPIETVEWEPVPDQPGYSRIKRHKTVREVYDELRKAIGTDEHGYIVEPGIDEYFSCLHEGDWPDGRICVFAVRGSSEGDYVHVEVEGTGNRTLTPSTLLLLGKTFQGRDAAWAAARRLADLLGA